MTYYDILEVSETASEEVIRMAYKALAKKYHPDVFQGDSKEAEEKMKQINEAFETLSNKEKREQYDNNLRNKKNSSSMENQYSVHPNQPPINDNKVGKQSKVSKFGVCILIFSILTVVIIGILNGIEITNNENNSITNASSYTENKHTLSEWRKQKIIEKSNFLDESIVFVIEGFDNYYYTYDEMVYVTKQIDEYLYWAYNKEQAISLDYVASNINVCNGWSSEKADFLDQNIVFVIDGFGNYYYTYDEMIAATEQMDEYEYWAYNKEKAIDLGYIHH